MSVVANIAINVDSTKAVSQLQAVDRAAAGLSGNTGKLQQAFGGLNTALAGLGVGLALAKVVGDVKELDTNMRRLGTVGGNVKELDGALGQLSTTIGGTKNKTELATAAYQAASAGFSKTTDTVKALEAATKASVGGLADMEGVTSVLVKTLNAYGLSANDSYKVTDSISKAVEIGNQEWSDYVSQLGRVASIASLAGVNLDEVNAFIASATKNGATAEIAFTGLGASLNTLLQPTKESQEAAKELGIEWNLGGLQAKGFTGLMKELGAKMSTNKEAAARLLGSQEAMRGAFAAASKGGMDYVNALAAIQNAAGKTDEDFQKMKGSLENQLKALDTAFKNLSEVLGKALMPILIPAVQALTAMINAFASLPAPIQTVVVGIGLVAAAILAIGAAVAFLAPVIAGFQTFAAVIGAANIGGIIAGWLPVVATAMSGITAAFSGLLAWIGGTLIPGLLAFFSGPVGWTVLAVAAVVAMVVLFRKPIMEFFTWLGGAISTAFSGLVKLLYPIFVQPFIDLWNNVLRGPVTTMFNWIGSYIQASMQTAYALAYQAFVQPWVTLWDKVLRNPVTAGIKWIQDTWKGIAKFFTDNVTTPISKAWTAMVEFLPKAMDKIGAKVKSIFAGVVNTVKGALRSVLQFIANAVNSVGANVNKLIGAFNRLPGPDIPMVPTLNVPAFAEGGVVDRPTLAMVGEGGEREYIIPQSKMAAAASSYLSGTRGAAVLGDTGSSTGSAQPVINITTGPVMQQNGENYVTVADMQAAVRSTASAIFASLRTPAGRYATGIR